MLGKNEFLADRTELFWKTARSAGAIELRTFVY